MGFGGGGVRKGVWGGCSPHSNNSSLPYLHIHTGLENTAPCRYCCHTMPQLWETHPAPFCRPDTPATEFLKEH